MLLVEGAFPVRFERCYWLDATNKIFSLVWKLTKSYILYHIVIIRIIIFVVLIVIIIVIIVNNIISILFFLIFRL